MGGGELVAQLPRSASTVSVAAVFGSTIAACRTIRGSPVSAACTVSWPTLTKPRLTAAHCGGSVADPLRAYAEPVDHARHLDRVVLGQVADQAVVGARWRGCGASCR